MVAVLEPAINVALLPFHERAWHSIQVRVPGRRLALLAAERFSQSLMHAAIAFGALYMATGSIAFGGLAAVLEPIINVIALPFHDQLFDRHILGRRALAN